MGQAPLRTVPPAPPWRNRLCRGGVFWRLAARALERTLANCARTLPLLALPLMALLLLAGGCADSGPSPVTLNTLQRWLLRYTAPPAKPIPAARPPQMVFIDLEVLAHYHPDWQLADALAGLAQPVPPPARVVALPSPPRPLAPLYTANAPEVLVPAITLRAGPNPALVRGEEIQAVDTLVEEAERRQAELATQETDIANQELEQQIAAAQRKRLVDLQPAQLTLEDQNRLTNLRLSLLRNLSRTAQERAASEAELDQLLRTWSEALRGQEAAHRAQMDEIYQRIPAQMRAAGQSAIAAAAAKKQSDRVLQREAVKDQQEALIAQDLSSAELAIEAHLPAAPVPASGGEPAWPKEYRTLPYQTTSTAPFPKNGAAEVPAGSPPGTGRVTQIAGLRAHARLEAAAWARLAALKLGVVWSPNRRFPDDTRAALAVLFGTRTGAKSPENQPHQS